MDLAESLANAGKLDVDRVVDRAHEHRLVAEIRPEGYLHIPAYATDLQGSSGN